MKKPAPQPSVASVSFFVPGIPTGHGKVKFLDPTIGKTFIDGLHTLAKAGPEQRWKHAIMKAARPFLRGDTITTPSGMILSFVFPSECIVTPWHFGKPEIRDCIDAVVDTLVEIGLLRSECLVTLGVQKNWAPEGLKEGCDVQIFPRQ